MAERLIRVPLWIEIVTDENDERAAENAAVHVATEIVRQESEKDKEPPFVNDYEIDHNAVENVTGPERCGTCGAENGECNPEVHRAEAMTPSPWG